MNQDMNPQADPPAQDEQLESGLHPTADGSNETPTEDEQTVETPEPGTGHAAALPDGRTVVISPIQIAAFVALMGVLLVSGFWIGQSLKQRGSPEATGPLPTPPGGAVCSMGIRNHPVVGSKPYEVLGKLLDGTQVKLSDYLGKPLMINFWATWCPPCRMEMPWMEEAYVKYHPYGFTILAIAGSENVMPGTEADVVGNFTRQLGIQFPVMVPADGNATQYQYQVNGLPSSFLVDRNGIVQNAVLGAFSSPGELEACLQEVVQRPN